MGRTACTEPHCLYKGALNIYFNDVVLTQHFYRITLTFQIGFEATDREN